MLGEVKFSFHGYLVSTTCGDSIPVYEGVYPVGEYSEEYFYRHGCRRDHVLVLNTLGEFYVYLLLNLCDCEHLSYAEAGRM